jgi:hypothetical protein
LTRSLTPESTRNDKIFVNVGVFCVDSVDVESLHVDSVNEESDSASTQCEGDESSKNRHT